MSSFQFKIFKHIFLYAVEILTVSGIISCLFEKLQPSSTMYEGIEKFFFAYGIYQLLVYVILSTIDDIYKDSVLMLISLLKLCILFKETNDENIKNTICEKIQTQLTAPAMNSESTELLLQYIYNNIDSIDRTSFQVVLAAKEHDLEYYQLQWRLSFLLRIVK